MSAQIHCRQSRVVRGGQRALADYAPAGGSLIVGFRVGVGSHRREREQRAPDHPQAPLQQRVGSVILEATGAAAPMRKHAQPGAM